MLQACGWEEYLTRPQLLRCTPPKKALSMVSVRLIEERCAACIMPAPIIMLCMWSAAEVKDNGLLELARPGSGNVGVTAYGIRVPRETPGCIPSQGEGREIHSVPGYPGRTERMNSNWIQLWRRKNGVGSKNTECRLVGKADHATMTGSRRPSFPANGIGPKFRSRVRQTIMMIIPIGHTPFPPLFFACSRS